MERTKSGKENKSRILELWSNGHTAKEIKSVLSDDGIIVTAAAIHGHIRRAREKSKSTHQLQDVETSCDDTQRGLEQSQLAINSLQETSNQFPLEKILNEISDHLANIKTLEAYIDKLNLEISQRDELIKEKDKMIEKYKLQVGARNPSGRPSLISDDERHRVIEMRANKISLGNIAKATSLSYASVQKILAKAR